MVKKISVICTCIFLLTLTASPVVAQISYCKDFLEPGNSGGWGNSTKTFDETWVLNPGETVNLEIWINDVPEPLITAGCFITYDSPSINITEVIPYDTTNGGEWDPGFSRSFQPDGTTDLWVIQLGNFGCVSPDEDGDILLGRITFQYQSSDNADITIRPIPDFDTIVGCPGTNYDLQIMQNTITINNGNGTSSTTTGPGTSTSTSPSTTTGPGTSTSTSPSTTTGPGTSTSTTSAGTSTTITETSSSSWQSAYAMMWGEDKEQMLSLLRYFRDEAVARNQVVRNYVSLLYQHTVEVAGVFIKYPLLCLETRELVEALLPSIESFFETEKLILTAGQQDRVETFLNAFEVKASPELKEIIQNFRKDLRDGRLFLTIS